MKKLCLILSMILLCSVVGYGADGYADGQKTISSFVITGDIDMNGFGITDVDDITGDGTGSITNFLNVWATTDFYEGGVALDTKYVLLTDVNYLGALTNGVVAAGDAWAGTKAGRIWTMTYPTNNSAFTNDSLFLDATAADLLYLGILAKAADSDKLDNIDSTGFYRITGDTLEGDIVGGYYNLTNVNNGTFTNGMFWGNLDLFGANTKYLTLTDDIEAEVAAATAGDTLVLAKGTYTVTDDIDIDKAITIDMNGATIACATDAKYIFHIVADDVTVKNGLFSINASGTYPAFADGSAGAVFDNVNFENITATFTAHSGDQRGFQYYDAGGYLRDIVIKGLQSTDLRCRGVYMANLASAEAATKIDCYNVVVEQAVAAGVLSHAFSVLDSSASQDATLNLYNCKGVATDATGDSYGASATGSDAILNIYGGTFSGGSYDVAALSSGVPTIYSSTLVNGTTVGTVTSVGEFNAASFHANNSLCEADFNDGASQDFSAAGYTHITNFEINVCHAIYTATESNATVAVAGWYNAYMELSWKSASAANLACHMFTNGVAAVTASGNVLGWNGSTTVTANSQESGFTKHIYLNAGTVVDWRIQAGADETITWNHGTVGLELK